MKSIRMADDDYLEKVKGHIDNLASFDDNPNFAVLAPIVEFTLKAMIEDCYVYGSNFPEDFIKIQVLENELMKDSDNLERRYSSNAPYDGSFKFNALIILWKNGCYNLLYKIHSMDKYPLFMHSIPFDDFRKLRNNAMHNDEIINKVTTYKYYYIFLELFHEVIPNHIKIMYPSILNKYKCYYDKIILNKDDKQSQLDEVINKLDQFMKKNDQQLENQNIADNPDKMAEILNKVDFINFIDNLKQIMVNHLEGQQNNKKSIKLSKLKNENNYISFIDNLDLGKESTVCEVNRFIPNINYDLLPFSSSNFGSNDKQILLDYSKDCIGDVGNESGKISCEPEAITTSDDGFISGTFEWIKKITKAGSLVADKFLADVKRRAEDGSAHFQNVHGVLHFHGSLVSKDLNEAFKWFVASASQGYAPAQLNLGKMYLKGFNVKVNHARAIELFIKAANQGLVEAIEVLAVINYFGEGTEKNLSLAEKWFVKAAESGSAKAQENLGIIYYKNGDYFKSVEYLAMAAKADVACAQNLLGVIYCTRDEVKDYVKAESMFKKAIKNEYMSSRINLSILYFKNSQFDKKLKDIEKILKPLVTDDSEAQYSIGVMYYRNGYFEEAVKWFEMAAKKEAKALYNLGTMYFNGEGYSKSIDDALRMYNRAIDNHPLANAYLSLGFIHYNGVKTHRLYEEALEYFKLAAEQGAPLADKILAKMYFHGIGTDVDYDQFYQRCRSAYVRGEHDVLEFAQLP